MFGLASRAEQMWGSVHYNRRLDLESIGLTPALES